MSRILVTGAGGHLGGLVIKHLLESQNVEATDIVAASRNPEKLAAVAEKGVSTRKVDFDDAATLAEAFAGVEQLLIVSTDAIGEPGKRFAQHEAAVAAAKAAGVKRIYYTSLPRPETSLISFAPDHLGTEKVIRESGLAYTIFRNGWYGENLFAGLPQAFASGKWYSAAGNGRISYAAREDIARAIAAGIARPVSQNIIYTLTGEKGWTTEEIAAAASEITGKPLDVVQVDDEALRAGLTAAGLPEPVVQILVSIDADTRDGGLDVVTQDIENLTGAKPQDLRAFLEENKARLAG